MTSAPGPRHGPKRRLTREASSIVRRMKHGDIVRLLHTSDVMASNLRADGLTSDDNALRIEAAVKTLSLEGLQLREVEDDEPEEE